MSEIRPIETRYKGYRFRSRLEARWAVFFDALGVPWEYEAEGYQTTEGGYLPDFRLFGSTFAEVKPAAHLDGALKKLFAFVIETGHNLIVLSDPPDMEWYPILEKDGPSNVSVDWIDFSMSSYKERLWRAYCGEQRPPYEDLDKSDAFLDAIDAARSARFEHGETPR